MNDKKKCGPRNKRLFEKLKRMEGDINELMANVNKSGELDD